MSVTKDRSIYVTARRDMYRADTMTYFKGGGTLKLLRSRTGESNPHWRQQVRDQQNATTNMTGFFDTLELSRAEAFVLHKNINVSSDNTLYRSWAKGDLLGAQLADWTVGISENNANNRALIAFLKNVRGAQVQFSAPTFLGELRETMKMIRSPAKGLFDLADSWMKKQPRHIFRDRKSNKGQRAYKAWKQNLSSAWLEQAFGWQPLINDINTAFKTYKGLRDRKDQIPVSGFGIDSRNLPGRTLSDQSWSLTGTNIWYLYNQLATEECFVKYHGMVKREVTGSLANKLEPFGFTIDEWLPTAWELLPWSFLIDYFSNIGDVITCSVAERSSLAWTNRVRVFRQKEIFNGWYDDKRTRASLGNKYISGAGDNLRTTAVRRTVKRDRGYAVGSPTLSFEIPGLPTQWANMTALFAQAFSNVHPQRRP